MRLKLRIAVLTALLSAVAAFAVPATAAQAAECPEPGGTDRPFEVDLEHVDGEDDVAVTGGGWGHGVGMSQYGAQGAALLGCTHEQILQTYYTDVTVEPIEMPPVVQVGLLDLSGQSSNSATVTVSTASEAAGGAPVPWRLADCDKTPDPTVCDPQPPDQPPGTTWRVKTDDGGRYHITNAEGAKIWSGGDFNVFLRVRHEPTVVTVDTPQVKRTVKWGWTQFDSRVEGDVGKMFAVQHIDGTDEHSSMERYLWGLAEVPSSWPTEALKAQAVAARSYAQIRVDLGEKDRCRCHLYATVRDQHYSGWDKEAADAELADEGEDGPWKQAVNDTAVDATTANVMRYTDEEGDTRVADGFYSSSHGGWSDAARDVWGGNVPYLLAVDTSRWEDESDNPRQRWTNGFTDEELASRFGFDSFQEIEILQRGKGGRPTTQNDRIDPECGENEDEEPFADDGAQAIGIVDGETVHRCLDGEDLRSKLGVFSGLVHLERLSDVPFDRLVDEEHRNRIGTSVAMSRHGWDEGATEVVIARADDPADALAGATLAGEHDAPLLITNSDALHEAVVAEVNRLGATTAYVLGGEKAISTQVVADLEESTTIETVARVFGPSRVGTAVAIAERLEPESVTNKAYLVYSAPGDSRAWPDALAVSGTAARRSTAGAPWPVLITGKELPDETLQQLHDRAVSEVVIVGGTAVVPQTVEARLVDEGFQTRRLAGKTRYETSVKVATEDGAPPGTLLAATADNFPDGLSAGALAGKLDVTLLLVPTAELADTSRAWVSALEWETTELLVAGGTAAVSDTVVTELRDALG